MKIIDLLNNMANGEQLPNKILIRDVVYYLINDTYGNIVYSQTTDKKNWESFIDNRLNITSCLNEDVLILDTGVEISEEDTIDIERIEELELIRTNFIDMDKNELKDNINKNRINLNKLVQAVKQLNKEIKSIKGSNI